MDAFKNNLTIPCRFLTAVKKATDALQDVRPDLVFSKGGYVALPVVFAAHKLGIPCITHESDLSMGLANRLAKGKCKLILTAFPETAEGVKGGVYCGQPIRSELFGISRPAARKQLAEGTARKIILVFGGGSALFENCELRSVHDGRHMGFVAAPSHDLSQTDGFLFRRCRFTTDPAVPPGSVYLARPWRDHGLAVFEDCAYGPHIHPAGFDPWGTTHRNETARFRETPQVPGRVDWVH